jgi:hypothetical protein
MMLYLMEDPHADVRCSACSAIGSIIMFKCIFNVYFNSKQDINFILDCCSRVFELNLLNDASLKVRIMACWMVANIGLAFSNCELEDGVVIPIDILARLLVCVIKSSGDNDKVLIF